jgi:hypothetical protein
LLDTPAHTITLRWLACIALTRRVFGRVVSLVGISFPILSISQTPLDSPGLPSQGKVECQFPLLLPLSLKVLRTKGVLRSGGINGESFRHFLV